jgi:hypothetical protein
MRQDDGFHTGTAHLVDSYAGDTFRYAGAQCSLASRRLAEAGRQYATHYDAIDIGGVDAAAVNRTLDGCGAKLSCGCTAQRSLKCADRRSFGSYDYDSI